MVPGEPISFTGSDKWRALVPGRFSGDPVTSFVACRSNEDSWIRDSGVGGGTAGNFGSVSSSSAKDGVISDVDGKGADVDRVGDGGNL
jgi:hypothetical protein